MKKQKSKYDPELESMAYEEIWNSGVTTLKNERLEDRRKWMV